MSRSSEVSAPRTPAVLITGASSGLGAGMAKVFADHGSDLVITGRRMEMLQAVRASIQERNPGRLVEPIRLDVNQHEEVFAVFERAAARMGHLDRIVVNAGVGMGSTLGAGRHNGNTHTAQTNFVAGMVQCEAAMRVLYRQGTGQLVIISSVAAARGLPGPMNVYAASKAALVHLAEGIRSDVDHQGLPIKVSTIRPGYIDTEMQTRTGRRHWLLTDYEAGCRAMVHAIEREVDDACVPRWPWAVFSMAIKHLPGPVVRRLI